MNVTGAGVSSITVAAPDITPPTLSSSSPSDDATGVAINSNIDLTFSEAVDTETGTIFIKKVFDGSTVESFDVATSSAISGSGTTIITINPTSDLTGSTAYYVEIASTALDDAAGNSFAGIFGATTLNFETADITTPTLTFSPANSATGVAADANITISFSEAVRLLDNSTLTDTNVDALITLKETNSSGANLAFDATVSGNVVTINPTSDFGSGQVVYVAIGATVEDSADNAITASNATFTVVQANSPALDFAANEDVIRQQVQSVALQSIRNGVQEASGFMSSARDRFIGRMRSYASKSVLSGRNNIPFDIDGSTSVSTSSANINGNFFGQFGNFDGTYRRMTSGDFNLQRDENGNTTGALSGRIAWEYLTSDTAMLGWFVGAEYIQSDMSGAFAGDQTSFGASIGGYFVTELQDQLYLDGHLTVKQNEHDLQLTNGTLDLDSLYQSTSVLSGLTLTGVTTIDESSDLWPTFSINAARTDLGTIGFTGTAYGLTNSTLSIDGGLVSYADVSLAPKYRAAMDGQTLANSLLVATVTPKAMCEYTELSSTTSRNCGTGLLLGLLGTTKDGNGTLELELGLDSIGGTTRHSVALNADLRY
ncbi:hypothetical protein BSK21_03610 [Marivivens sp. JLT3646]|nr:hypothetical protein BSK21_03610 [Marivivens sp. JLT3646]